jgi:Short C-terminal domain
MPQLSPAGQQLVQNLSQRHGVSTDAITHMLIAVTNGNGTMAQFSHPEFGGAGQWMQGGMTMVSDLFNYQLKSRVNNICSDIANQLSNHQLIPFSGSFQSQSQNGVSSQTQAAGSMGSANSLFVPDPESNWWPSDLGSPSALGSQNNVRYAYFANINRLAVKTGNDVWVYDTLNHQIGGFSQQQGGGSSITFTSQFGTISLSSLPVVTRNGVIQSQPMPLGDSSHQQHGENVIDTLERLGVLFEKGYITADEFATKKADLLSRL